MTEAETASDRNDPVRVGVVGVGAIGRHHARIYAESASADLVGVFDTAPETAAKAASRHECTAFDSLGALLEAVEAVSIAVPTLDHRDVGLEALASVDALVEKPLAATLVDADALIDAAASESRILQVGHVERYNPAVEALLPRVTSPRFIEIHRLGSFAPRSLDVDVLLDLMIHDIDIVHALDGSEVEGIRAVGVPVLSEEVDIANARLELASGCTVNLTASRVSMNRVRKVRVFQPEAYFSVDYSEQTVASFKLERESAERPAISGCPVPVQKAEPLVRELEDFLECVRTRRPPRVAGTDGRRALATVLQIQESAGRRAERAW